MTNGAARPTVRASYSLLHPEVEVKATPLPPPEPLAPPPPAPAVHGAPAWFETFDVVLACLVLVPAFLVASFTARNSDLWLHLAAGRLVAQGNPSFGTDPFSHATEGRVWANHAWLLDAAAYLVYKADSSGAALVALKAIAFAVAFGLVMRIRRAGLSLWPWVLVGLLGVVAAGPHAALRPLTVSALFLAATFYLLLGRAWKPGSRQNAYILAGLFWLWANVDGWFLLGPAVVLLVLLGELLQKFVLGTKDDADALAPTFTVPQLALTLLLGLVACCLTPNHVRVWQVPYEFGTQLAPTVLEDPYFANFLLSPTTSKFANDPSFGANSGGVAYAALFALGTLAVGLGLAFGRLRFAYLLLWLAFGFLSFQHYALILFFGVAAVPIVATAINGLANRAPRKPADSPAARIIDRLSGVGRILTFVLIAGVGVAAWPGWLHPKPSDPSVVKRVAWAVEPDPASTRTALLVQEWRAAGKLPETARGLILSLDVANYFAWFAPSEKVFANSRFAFHGGDFADLVKARKVLRMPTSPDEIFDAESVKDVCESRKMNYLIYAGAGGNGRPVDLGPGLTLALNTPDWAAWHVDGRAFILGTRGLRNDDPAKFDALGFNPIRLAFDPDQKPVPDGKVLPAPERKADWYDDFLEAPPQAAPLAAQDARAYYELATVLFSARSAPYQRTWPLAWFALSGGAGVERFVPPNGGSPPLPRANDAEVALRILAIRAARRAVAAAPDHPDGYFALYLAYQSTPPGIPGVAQGDVTVQQIAALRQSLDRMPLPDAATTAAAQVGYEAAALLSEIYLNEVQMIDLHRDAVRLASDYRTRTFGLLEDREQLKKVIEMRDKMKKDADDKYAARNEAYKIFEETRNPSVPEKLQKLLQERLPGRAIKLFKETVAEKTDALGPQAVQVAIVIVRFEIQAGRLADAQKDLADLEEIVADGATGNADKNTLRLVGEQVKVLRADLAKLGGDASRQAELMEARAPRQTFTDDQKRLIALSMNANLWSGTFLNGNGALGGGIGALVALNVLSNNYAPPVTASWAQELQFYSERGMAHLFEGNIADAKKRFQQSLAPQGVPAPAGLPQRELAERYLRLIEEGAKK